MAASYRAPVHLMRLTLASTRFSARALVGFLAFPMGCLFQGGVYFKIVLFCKITDIKYHLNETDRSRLNCSNDSLFC